jgi:DNA-binding LacI/PurR family transcriptional regulator
MAIDGTRETAFAKPPLTAVEIPWYDMLALGAKLLIEMIEQHADRADRNTPYHAAHGTRIYSAKTYGRDTP